MLQRPNQVLVIDDDEAAREILVELLGRIGYHAFATGDGKAGLEWLAGAAAPPQAVLLDLRMPILDGFEVLRRDPAHRRIAPPHAPPGEGGEKDGGEAEPPRAAGLPAEADRPGGPEG